jgi:hypothetical protein
MFDKRRSARVNLEDLLHTLHVLSGDGKKEKLTRTEINILIFNNYTIF